MRKGLILGFAALLFVMTTTPAHAGFSMRFHVGVPVHRAPRVIVPPRVYAPPPVVVGPPGVYHAPRPIHIPGRWHWTSWGWHWAPGYWINR